MKVNELLEASYDDIFWHGGANVKTSSLHGNDIGVLYVTRNKKSAEHFYQTKLDMEDDAKLHQIVITKRNFADEPTVVKIAKELGIRKDTYPDGTSQLFDPEFGDDEEKQELVDKLKEMGFNGAYITDDYGNGKFRAVALFV